jgi:dienelactone hydrolase
VLGVCAIAVGQPPLSSQKVPPFLDEFQSSKLRDLPLFLDEFHLRTDPPARTENVWVRVQGDGGWFGDHGGLDSIPGFWARVERKEPLPAILLVYDDAKLDTWMQTNARHLASIGYAVLAVWLECRSMVGDLNGTFNDRPQAELSACMRWLRRRPEVLPGRFGVVSLGSLSGRQTLMFASSRQVQACVVCDGFVESYANVLRGLRGTPMLAVYGADDQRSSHEARRLEQKHAPCKLYAAPNARTGFLGPPDSKAYNHDAAEDAWVAIYNFLEKHVEDARPAEIAAPPALKSVATVADIMKAINDPSGVRGTLSRALEQPPKTDREWRHIRATAALMAQSGVWLEGQAPPKGSVTQWQEQARAYTAAAQAIVDAADRREHGAAQQALQRLAGQCAACHHEHR